HAVFTTALVAMEDVEDAIDPVRTDRIDQRGYPVDREGVDTAGTQRVQHVAAGIERDLSLGTGAAHQHGDAAEDGRIGDARGGEIHAHFVSPANPLAANCCAAWPMSPAPIISSRSPSLRTSGSTPASSPALPTTIGSMRPRVRMARASDFASAPAIGASPAG